MSEWISVKDRLPERGRRVLVCSYIGILKKEPFISVGFYDDYLTGELLCYSVGGHVMCDQPVLWRDFPDAPPYDSVKE